ncbi:SRPBCC domain-containing protein [uncultured Roseovarius sp.]|uniref:CoxG family protein n=1 Tax=uncultured Roseovarius sp. TaxID=293344 RepID=UPI00259ACD0E|nr:SRPBCC domain-containing protein [uncultured Roseovarius sp.]
MKFTGEFTVPAGREVVFARLQDHALLAECVDGVQEVEPLDERNYKVKLQTRLAYIRIGFTLDVSITEIEAPAFMKITATGKPLGMVGRLSGDATLTLTELEAEGQTLVSYVLDLAVAGKLGSIGQPVFKSKAKEMESSFVEKFNASLESENADARL